ncbi:barstar family protein [Nocardiopsis valliformis]|uniref:barstar family protein n=1 Tax=Nocardiopsis valliformis TaxID=239974 RepID=UPI00034DA913|nr:barstar family protein [Nocardiopsis valliformis]
MLIDISGESTESGIRSAFVRALGLPSEAGRDWSELTDALVEASGRFGGIRVVGWNRANEVCPEGAAAVTCLSRELGRLSDPVVLTLDGSVVPDEVTVDLGSVSTPWELHRVLKAELGFPGFYGMNWDAFWDAITGLVDLPTTLRFTGWRHLEETCPRDAGIMREMLEEDLAADRRRRSLSFDD